MSYFRDGKLVNPAVEARYREVEEVWQPQLDDIADEATALLGLDPLLAERGCGFTIEYEPNGCKHDFACINWHTKNVYVGNKFFRMSDADKRRALMHELGYHAIMRRSKHPRYAMEHLEERGIAGYVPKEYADPDPDYKYIVRCKECGAIVAKRQVKSKVIQQVKRYKCSRCRGQLEVIEV